MVINNTALTLDSASKGFAAAGAAPRLAVLKKLVRSGPGGLSVGDLRDALGMPPSTLAHHLRFLTEGGLIIQEKRGRQIINIANFSQMRALAEFLMSECCMDSADPAGNPASQPDENQDDLEKTHIDFDRLCC